MSKKFKKNDVLAVINDYYSSNFRQGLGDLKPDPRYNKSKYLPKASTNLLLQKMGMANYMEGLYSDSGARLDRVKGNDEHAAYIRFLYSFMSNSERKKVDAYFDENGPLVSLGVRLDEVKGSLLPRQREFYSNKNPNRTSAYELSYEDFLDQIISPMQTFRGIDIANYRDNEMLRHFRYWKHEYDVLPQAYDRRVEMHAKNYIIQVDGFLHNPEITAELKSLSPQELYEMTIEPETFVNTRLPTFFNFYQTLSGGDSKAVEDYTARFKRALGLDKSYKAKSLEEKTITKYTGKEIQNVLRNTENFYDATIERQNRIMRNLWEERRTSKNPWLQPYISKSGNYVVPFLGSSRGKNLFSEYIRQNPDMWELKKNEDK